MLYEFLQRNEIDTKAVTILTDGIKKGEANLFGVAVSDVPGLVFGREPFTAEDPYIIPVPGADPAQNYQHHEFPENEYKRMTTHCSYEDSMRELGLLLQNHDLFINYNSQFFERFLDPDMFSSPWRFFDITIEHCFTSEIEAEVEKQENKEDLIDTFLSMTKERAGSAAHGSTNFKRKSQKIQSENQPSMEGRPIWERNHLTLRTLITEC